MINGRVIALLGVTALMVATMPAAAAETAGDPYSLGTCPISGKALDANAVVKDYDGREVRFCCGGCPGKFEADQAKQMAKLDDAMTADQLPHYPLTTCVVGGGEMKEGKAVTMVVNNRLVKLCCAKCEKAVEDDPAAYIAKIDEAVIAAQDKNYPLKTCPVSGEALDAMGDPVNVVVANRLVKLCCEGCAKKLKKDPVAMLSKLDAGDSAAAGAADTSEPEGS